jgi:hypothetical protein
MVDPSTTRSLSLAPDLKLPVSLLVRYLFFLTRRPISGSNSHYLERRLDGLRSLATPLAGADDPCLQDAARQLRALTPANFHRLAERLQSTLLPFGRAIAELPPDFVVSQSPPQSDFFSGAGRVLLLMGPAIGVGDELILFPLPSWIKSRHPDAEVTVMSAYSGLWIGVNGADHVLHYSSYLELVDAVRGESPGGRYDLVMLADFERPDLHQAVCAQPKIERYIELSIGARALAVVDGRNRWLHRTRIPAPYLSNYYFALDYLARWLSLSPSIDRSAIIGRQATTSPSDCLRIYVNAFTAKYDPSPIYWSRLIDSLFPNTPARPVELIVEQGPNKLTETFALSLVRSAAARAPKGVRVTLAPWQNSARTSFDAAFAQMESARIVLCADSFTAHAAPMLGCTTMVIAAPGLENWRVPSDHVFYFNANDQIEDIAGGMRQLLDRITEDDDASSRRYSLAIGLDLHEAGRRLERLLDRECNEEFVSLCAAHDNFARAYGAVVDHLGDWASGFAGLFSDFSYDDSRFSSAERLVHPAQQADFTLHLRDSWQRWRNTNLYKYLSMVLETAA